MFSHIWVVGTIVVSPVLHLLVVPNDCIQRKVVCVPGTPDPNGLTSAQCARVERGAAVHFVERALGEVGCLLADAFDGGADVGRLHGGEHLACTDDLTSVLRHDLPPGEAPRRYSALFQLGEQNARELLDRISSLALLLASIYRFLEIVGRKPDLPVAVARHIISGRETGRICEALDRVRVSHDLLVPGQVVGDGRSDVLEEVVRREIDLLSLQCFLIGCVCACVPAAWLQPLRVGDYEVLDRELTLIIDMGVHYGWVIARIVTAGD